MKRRWLFIHMRQTQQWEENTQDLRSTIYYYDILLSRFTRAYKANIRKQIAFMTQ